MYKSRSMPATLRRGTALAVAIQLAFGPGAYSLALAGPAMPQGATVANGQVSISNPSASSMQINASSGAIVNWRSFSIGAGGQVQIGLPSATSGMLNRVTGAEASQLLGSLQSNGRIFLINPNGIVVGAGARIDTNSFIASTLDMADGDFVAGKLRFLAAPGAGSIRNDGVITAGPGGRIALIAPDVQNSGIIQAPGGQILLAAGRKLEISSLDFEGVTFEIQAPTDSVLNLGKLLAENGAVSAFAGSLRNSGEIRATKMVRDGDGSIRLMGNNEVTLTGDSVIRADGDGSGVSGGNVTIQSASGTTRVAGLVSAAAAGQGGDIQLLGDRVAIEAGAQIIASGGSGGGQILVGGDFQGKNAAVQNAGRVFVGEGASLKADATDLGDGGKVIVWADENTRYFGDLSVRGGPQGGNGGNAEVSGKQNLQFAGGADLGASKGTSGTLLLDPLDILVFNAGGILPSVVDQFSDFAGNVVTISPTQMAAINGSIVLQAERDIYFQDAVALTTPGAGLTATAGGATFDSVKGGQIYLNNNISTTAGAVTLQGVGISGAGTITTNGGVVDLKTSGAETHTGAISSGGGTVFLTSTQSYVNGANVDAGSGNVQVTGQTGIFSGTYSSTGDIALTTNAGSISNNQVTGKTVNLAATGGSVSSASVNAAVRVNASSSNSSVQLNNLAGQALRLGTVAGNSGVTVTSNAGIEQVAGGMITTPFFTLHANNSGVASGAASAPIVLTTPTALPGVSLTMDGLSAPAYVALTGGVELSRLSLAGTVAGLGATSVTGAANMTTLGLASASGVLNANAISTGGLASGLVLNVTDGGLSSTTLNLAGAPISLDSRGPMTLGTVDSASLNATAGGPVSIGAATTTGNSGIVVTTQKCDLSFSVCTDMSPIAAGSLTAGAFGGIQLTNRDNGDVTATTVTTSGGSVGVTAGSQYNNSSDRGPSFNKRFVTSGNINLGTVTSGGSFQATNRGNGNITIANPSTAINNVSIQAGTSYNHDGNNGTANVLTPSVITVAGLTGSSVNISNSGTGAVTATGNLTATSNSLSVSAVDGPVSAMAANSSASSSSFSSSVNSVAVGTIATTNSNAGVSISAGTDISFQAISAPGASANVNLTASQGNIKAVLDNSAADITSGGDVSLTAANAAGGYIGDSSFARPLDIVAGAAKTVTLNAGKNIGAVGKEVNVDTGGVISATTTGGQFFVSVETMAGAARTLTGIKLNASAAGMGNGGTSTFNSQDVNVNATSDGSTITMGDVVQAANVLNEFRFTSSGGGLTYGNMNLTTTGLNNLYLSSAGPLTQTSAGTNNINAGYVNLTAGSGAVVAGSVTSSSVGANSVGNSVDISGGDITTGNLTGPSVNVSGANLALGSVTSNGTRRGYPFTYLFIPHLNINNYVTDEIHLTASGVLSTSGNVSSLTSAFLSGANGVDINAGTGSVSAGATYNGYYADTANVFAGSGTLAANSINAYNINLSGTTLSTGAVAANSSLSVSGETLNTGTLSGGNGLQISGTTFNTGNMTTAGSLTVNATGAFAPTINLQAGSASITAPGGIDLGNHLTATTTRLDASGGDILAALNGTTGLTLNTGGMFTVTSTGTLNSLDVSANGMAAGAGPGSSVSANGANQTMTVVGPANALGVNWKSNSGMAGYYRESSETVTDMSVSTTGTLGSGSRVYVTAQNANVTAPSVALVSGNVEIYTAGDINLTSVQTSGSVTASTSGTGKNVNVERVVTTGGSVYLAASDGNIAKAGSQALQIDTRNGSGAASGTLTLSAANGSVGTGAAPLLTSGAVTLDVSAKNEIAVDIANTPLNNLYITTGASGAGNLSITNANYAGLSLTRSGTDLVLSGVNPTATGAFSLNATDGNIRVASDIGNVTNLTLNAGYGSGGNSDLLILANGSPRNITASGTLQLLAGRDVLIGADNLANASVTVQGVNSYLQANRNIEITAGSAAGANALVQGTYQQVNAGNDFKVVANGGTALLNSTTTSGQSLQAGRDIQITGGSGTAVGATAAVVSAGSQSIYIGNDLLVRGGATDGATAKLQAVFSQNISGGNNIAVTGGGDNASASISGTSQNMNAGPNGVISVSGGTGVNAFAEVVATSGSQNIGNQYTYYYPTTDKIEVLGGAGSGAYASMRTVAGSQTFYSAGDINVIGGSGLGANAELLAAGGGQTLGTSSNSNYYVPTQNITVQAQGGGTARIQASGNQSIYVAGDISVLGGTGDGMTAAIESTGSSQNIGYTYRFGNDPNNNIYVRGGSAYGTSAWIRAATGQTIDASQNIVVSGGADGSHADISSAAGFQSIGNLNSTSSYDRTDAISVQGGAGAGAWAKISSGGGQSIMGSTGISLASGSGAGSGAMILNTSGGQTVNTLGALSIAGGFGSLEVPNETGIVNTTGGSQSIGASNGISITGGGAGSNTWIKQDAVGGQQTISTQGALVLQAPTAGNAITSIESGTGGQVITVGDIIDLSNAGGDATRITSGANQSITADAMSITLASVSGANTRSEVSAVGNQVINLNGGAAPASLTVANFSGATGSSARLTAGGTQAITMAYFNAGKMQIGDVSSQGESLVKAGGDQTVVAGELLIQGGATSTADAILEAGTPTSGAMRLSTVNGPIQVLAGTAGSATIDPLTLDAVANGSIFVTGGAAATASAFVTAGTINMTATNGNMAVIGGGAPASVVATNQFNLTASGGLAFTPGAAGASISATNGGTIILGGPCSGCDTGLIGPFDVTAAAAPAASLFGTSPYLDVQNIFLTFNEYDQYGELILAEDGTLIYGNRRRGLNQCY